MKALAGMVAAGLLLVGAVFAVGQFGNDPEPVGPPDVSDAIVTVAEMWCLDHGYDQYSDEYARCVDDNQFRN